jgi:hypothetical protein
VRSFFDLELLSAGQWFLALLSAAGGLVLASVIWRLPTIQRLEETIEETEPPREEGEPRPTHEHVIEGAAEAAGPEAPPPRPSETP